ncbi:MAG: hypothetical protein Q8Q04_03110 [archaeon]|nr:hypothetical protein [archaeon]
MKKTILALFVISVLLVSTAAVFVAAGFDEYGYNYQARNFVGTADGVDKTLDGTVWGDSTYANDQLVMKWNKAWDDCNDAGNNDESACAGAWTNNEWNGAFPGGSGEVWHYKIIWVGSDLENSPYWEEGGDSIWGSYEVLMDQGTSNGEHIWFTHATPNGYGN